MTGFHVTIEPCAYGNAYQAIDNSRFDSLDEGGYTGCGIGDTPYEACQDLIDSQRKQGVSLNEYIAEMIKAHEFCHHEAMLLYRTSLFVLDVWRDTDYAYGRALEAAVNLSEKFAKMKAAEANPRPLEELTA